MVAVFSHDGVIKAVVAHPAGIPLEFYYRLDVSSASVSIATTDDHGPRLPRVNDTGERLFANHYNPTFVRLCTDDGYKEA
jgi:broad specificity phosphatase PhoE